jgi:hypothetical protein
VTHPDCPLTVRECQVLDLLTVMGHSVEQTAVELGMTCRQVERARESARRGLGEAISVAVAGTRHVLIHARVLVAGGEPA